MDDLGLSAPTNGTHSLFMFCLSWEKKQRNRMQHWLVSGEGPYILALVISIPDFGTLVMLDFDIMRS